jgi:hypothetical protein
MGGGTWTMACVLLLGQVPSDVDVSNQRNHKIPFGPLSAEQRQEIRDVLLFASRDQGKTWQQIASARPDQDGFVFYAPDDGLYWFRAAVVNRQGKQEPENIYQGPPDQKMLIDSTRPLIRIGAAQRSGDEIAVAWEIREEHPDLSSLRLEYRMKDNSSPWTAVPINPGLKGETRFRVTGAAAVDLRLQLKDVAGNLGFAPAEVGGTAPVAATAPPIPAFLAAAPAFPSPVSALPPASAPPVAHTPLAHTPVALPPDVRPNPPALTPSAYDVVAAPRPFPERVSPPPPSPSPQAPPSPPSQAPSNPAPHFDPHTRLVASSEMAGPHGAAPRKPLPALQYVNVNEVTLEYELTKVGPSGVGSIELWWTQNDGQSWERYAVDDTARPNMPSGRHQRTIELQGDGIYGFALVIKSRAGLGRPNPKAGDVPEMRIEVDTTPPVVGLFAPQADTQRPGHLLLQWTARDNNLTAAPITLEWCERLGGNWTAIAGGLPNTGRYSWQLPDGLPYQVFLRVRARDAAGNEGLAVTPEPQLVDLSEPEGRLLNVTVPQRR